MSQSGEDRPYDHLIFDLDDTLLDTYRQLVPRASRDACTAMVEAGLNATVDSCMTAWEEHGRNFARRDIFVHMVGYFGVREKSSPEGVAKRGFHAFYNRKVESDISLFPRVKEMLVQLRAKYKLYLVTSGSRPTQEEKIRHLGLRDYFVDIKCVDLASGQRKIDAFAAIMFATKSPPPRHLSIGNRIDTDVAEARRLGWKACWVRYGEYVNIEPAEEIEQPDFIIDNIGELIGRCRL